MLRKFAQGKVNEQNSSTSPSARYVALTSLSACHHGRKTAPVTGHSLSARSECSLVMESLNKALANRPAPKDPRSNKALAYDSQQLVKLPRAKSIAFYYSQTGTSVSNKPVRHFWGRLKQNRVPVEGSASPEIVKKEIYAHIVW